MVLPEVIRFNATSALDRYAEIAELLGEDLTGASRDEAAERAAAAVQKIASDVGIEDGLASIGVAEDNVGHLAEQADQLDRLLAGNPRRIEQADLEEIIRRSL
jgi:alcohol dehydrogenase class IV